MTELSLARGFPPPKEADWRSLVEEALKGAPLSSLGSQSYDGFAIEPLYSPAPDATVLAGRTPGEPWGVMQRVDIADPVAANRQILDDLNHGASGLVLVFAGAVGDYGYALPASKEAIETVLAGVNLDWGVALELDFGPPSREAAGIVAAYVKGNGLAPASVKIRFTFDPLGALASRGMSPMPAVELAPFVASRIAELVAQGFNGPFAAADGRPVHAAGGSEAQELAFVVANALAYLRALEAQGIALDEARCLIFFRLAADQDQFLTIAKFRALRKLWARVEEACGLAPKPVFIAAETAWRIMTKRDSQGNIVRGTIAALAAAVGGADAVTVLPYTAALGVPDALARRIARNTQTILTEESNLHRVADPAAGSGAIEALTDQLCARAWALFQDIERAGGAAAALEAGLIQQAVAKVRAEREANIARRKDPLVGTSDFPDLHEEAASILGTPNVSAQSVESGSIPKLPRIRLAEPFEVLRDRSDACLAEHGARPKVFLACLGRPSDFTARASFAKSLFEAGGIEAISPEGTFSRDDMLKAFKTSGAQLACLCSSDKVYAAEAVDTAKALTASGAKHLYLAGKRSGALEQAGIGAFLYQGCDTLQLLHNVYERLGA
jgi:methylmalonyl-CoA mutase